MTLGTRTILLVVASLIMSGLVPPTDANGECVTNAEFIRWWNTLIPDYDPVGPQIMEKPTIKYATNDTYGPGATIKLKRFDVNLGNVDDPSIEYTDGELITLYPDTSLSGTFGFIFLTTKECNLLNYSIQIHDHPAKYGLFPLFDDFETIRLAASDVNSSYISFNTSETLTLFESGQPGAPIPQITLPANCSDYKRYCIQLLGMAWNTAVTCYPFDENLPYCGLTGNSPVQVTDMHHYRFVPNQKILDQASIDHVNNAPNPYSFLIATNECETGITETFNDVFVVDVASNQTSGNIIVKVDGVNMQCEDWAREGYRPLVVKVHVNNLQVPSHSYLGNFRLCNTLFPNATSTKCEFSCPCEGNICNPVFVDFLSMTTPSVSSICEITVLGGNAPPSETFD